jgi:GNAT superfamily N-acetyltransferase
MNRPLFLIRQAKHADESEMRHLIERSIRVLQKTDYTSQQMDGALGHTLGLDTQLVNDGTYFVAMPISHPELIVGCGGWSFRKTLYGSNHVPSRDNTLLDPATEPAKIRAIFVHPDWARQGLGTLLLKHSEDAARQAGFRTMEMGSTLTGVPLYLLNGYMKREAVDIPLPNGESLPIIHMVKTLGG